MKIYKLFRDLNIYMNFVCFELISIHKSIVPIVFSVLTLNVITLTENMLQFQTQKIFNT